MLQFNPNKRISVEEALEHPFLADFRDVSREIVRVDSTDSCTGSSSSGGMGLNMEIERMPMLMSDDIRINVSAAIGTHYDSLWLILSMCNR
jgi:hypothetical protein